MNFLVSCIIVNDAKEKANFILYYQVNCAWSLNHTKSRSIDLGIHTEACMTRPETCGAAGGAISVWVNVIECVADRGGIVSSRSSSSSGSVIYCTSSDKTVYDLASFPVLIFMIFANLSGRSFMKVLFHKIYYFGFITVRKRSCGNVMFSQACVKNSVHRRLLQRTVRILLECILV